MNEDLWRAWPHTYARAMSGRRWVPYEHLRLLSTTVTDAIRQGNGRIIVSMPPRHGKSELCSYWLPTWLLDWDPSRRVILTSYGAELAQRYGRRIRDTMQTHPKVRTRLQQGSEASHRFDTTAGGGLIAQGVGGAITGFGGDLLIIDDPVKNWEEALSETYRQRTVDWFQSVLYTRAEPGATIVTVMTRWHEDDLAGWLEHEHADDWTVIRLAALAEPDDPMGRDEGAALCPERFDADRLAQIRNGVGERVFGALYQQRPSPSGGELFQRSWFRRFSEPPHRFDRLAISADLTFGSQKDSASFAVIAVWGQLGADFYRLDEMRGRWTYPETRQRMIDMRSRWPGVGEVLVERKANGQAIIDDLASKVPGLIPIDPSGSKYARAQAAAPMLEAGNVWIPQAGEWADAYVEELVSFPNGKNDDRVDETSQLLRRWSSRLDLRRVLGIT